MVRIIAIDQILHDRAAFEQTDRVSILEDISQRWDTTVRVNFQGTSVPWSRLATRYGSFTGWLTNLLLVLAQVNFCCLRKQPSVNKGRHKHGFSTRLSGG